SGTVTGDGRNEFIQYTPLVTGNYRVRVTNEGSTRGEYFLTKNFSPVVTSLTASPIDENGTATLTGTFSDPDVLDMHTVTITWGGGTPGQPSEGSTTLANADLTYLGGGVWSFSATHQYPDDNPTGTPFDDYSIGVTVVDNHGASGTGTTTVTVNNAAPTATSLNSGSIN